MRQQYGDRHFLRERMRKVFSAGSYIEAQLIRAFLEQADIRVTIMNENSSGVPGTPHWALPVAAELWVLNNHQYVDAARLVREYLKQQSAPADVEWICEKCRENNPGSFELCWKCGHPANPTL
jgi:hypothetical protein